MKGTGGVYLPKFMIDDSQGTQKSLRIMMRRLVTANTIQLQFCRKQRADPLFRNRRLFDKSFSFGQYLILGRSTDVPPVYIDKGTLAARSAIGLAANLDLSIRCHLAQLGENGLHPHKIAFITYLYFVSHKATLLFVRKFRANA